MIHALRNLLFGITAATVMLPASPSQAQTGTLFGVANTGVSNNRTATLLTIDPLTGAGTVVGVIGSGASTADLVDGIAFDPSNGIIFGNFDANLITIDPLTAVPTFIGFTGTRVEDLTFDPITNALLGIDVFFNGTNTDTEVFSIDPLTGSTNRLAILGPTIRGIEFDDNGNLFGLQTTSDDPLLAIDADAGTTTRIGATGLGISNFGDAGALAFDPTADVLYSINGGQLIEISPSTGVATVVGPIGIQGVTGLAFAPAALVPEPTTYFLLVISSAAGLIGRRSSAAGRAGRLP